MLDELAAAVIFLTRLPIRFRGTWPDDLMGRAMGWFPLVGAGVGAAGGLVYWGAELLHLPPLLGALLALAAIVRLTGGLHEDGLADVADGFGGGRDRARKLEIMRDSRVGSYGALALVFSVVVRASALADLIAPAAVLAALAATGAASRAVLPLVAARLEPARRDGLAASHGRPPRRAAVLALALGLGIAAAALGGHAGPALAAGGAAALVTVTLAQRQIGGYTGDVMGAIQQTVETTMLITLAGLA